MKGYVLISFVGMDGSGKSTIARNLQKDLNEMDIETGYSWWLDAEKSVFRLILRKILRNKYQENNPMKYESRTLENNSFSMYVMTRLYVYAVIIDYLVFALKIIRTGRKYDVQIFDRFYWDTINALSKEFQLSDQLKENLSKIFRTFIRIPDVILFIDVPPEIALKRKPLEIISYKQAESLWRIHQELYSTLKNNYAHKVIKIENIENIESTRRKVLSIVLEEIRS